MLFDETLFELLDTDIALKEYPDWQFKIFCNEKRVISSTSAHILEPVYVSGHHTSRMSKVNNKPIKKHFQNS